MPKKLLYWMVYNIIDPQPYIYGLWMAIADTLYVLQYANTLKVV